MKTVTKFTCMNSFKEDGRDGLNIGRKCLKSIDSENIETVEKVANAMIDGEKLSSEIETIRGFFQKVKSNIKERIIRRGEEILKALDQFERQLELFV